MARLYQKNGILSILSGCITLLNLSFLTIRYIIILGDKMKKYIVGIGIFLLLAIVVFVLFIPKRNRLVGRWRALNSGDNYYYIFNKDKTCYYIMPNARLDCTYEIDDVKINILFKGEKKTKSYPFRFDNDNLIINDEFGKDNVFVPYND